MTEKFKGVNSCAPVISTFYFFSRHRHVLYRRNFRDFQSCASVFQKLWIL